MMPIVLCHKCAGNLLERRQELHCCGCISSGVASYSYWPKTMKEAVEIQLNEAKEWLGLYTRQRSEAEITRQQEQVNKIQSILDNL